VKEADVLKWFEDLLQRSRDVPEGVRIDGHSVHLVPQPAMAWLAEAHTALQSVFPPGHALHASWAAIFERAKTYAIEGALPAMGEIVLSQPYAKVHFSQAVGVIDAGASIVRAGHLRTLSDGVRAETVSELLDQADALLTANHIVAAAVLAGGALETHLCHLCQRNKLTWVGDGSIAKYDQAVAQARNAGTVEVYAATDTKLVGGWGGLRNDAAHDPTTFTRTVGEVRLMIEGIRQFIARVP
jgi:hypothetical protein